MSFGFKAENKSKKGEKRERKEKKNAVIREITMHMYSMFVLYLLLPNDDSINNINNNFFDFEAFLQSTYSSSKKTSRATNKNKIKYLQREKSNILCVTHRSWLVIS